MEVSEILGLHEYFYDPRFESKKPNLHGTWQERCGDNFYSRSADGAWIQHRNRFHLSEELRQQDTKHARVFIGSRFWYRGKSATPVPPRFSPIAGGRGARVNHNPDLVEDFCSWVSVEFKPGVGDVPNDNPDIVGEKSARRRRADPPGSVRSLGARGKNCATTRPR